MDYTLKIADSRAEREQAFQLVHSAYCQAGLADGSRSGMRVLPHHLSDDTFVFIATQSERVVFTMTLVGDGDYRLPTDHSPFASDIQALRESGLQICELSCLASSVNSFNLLVDMTGFAFRVARTRGFERVMFAAHPRHAKVYERLFGCVLLSDVQDYADVCGHPAVLCHHDFADTANSRYPLYDRINNRSYPIGPLSPMPADQKAYFQQFIPVIRK